MPFLDTEIAETADLGEKLVLDSYVFHSRPDRRDPFTDPRYEDAIISPDAAKDVPRSLAAMPFAAPQLA